MTYKIIKAIIWAIAVIYYVLSALTIESLGIEFCSVEWWYFVLTEGILMGILLTLTSRR